MKRSEDKINFEVQETLFFESGQEISEMVSISLDPDIVVQAYEDYIQIRGIILLQGEYKKEADPFMDSPRSEGDSTIRYIEKVIDGETEQAAMFSHRFPVEISVPPYRVRQLDQISVSVEAFDYELPSSNKLHVHASLHIHGINPEPTISTKQTEAHDPADDKITGASREVMSSAQPTSFDKQELHMKEVMENESDNASTTKTENSPPSLVTDAYHEEKGVEMNESELRKTDEQVDLHMDDSEKKADYNHVQEVEMEAMEAEPITEEIDIQFNEQLEESDETEVKDVAFLAELFNSDEEMYTKMKIYITQDDDTIESIAKRYEVPVLQLMKDNELSAESLQGGQLIKIPHRKE